MKKYILIAIICCLSGRLIGQSVKLENAFSVDNSQSLISFQKVEISQEKVIVKYDYFSSQDNTLGIIMPSLISSSSFRASAMVARKAKDGLSDQLIIESTLRKKFDSFKLSLRGGYMKSKDDNRNYINARLSANYIAAEAYVINEPHGNRKYYSWAAYSSLHAFISAAKADDKYWGFVGTKNLERFGVFTYGNYQPETGNFKVKSQFGFGDINQNFFCEDTYELAASYLVIPSFFQLHFSQVATKGTYSLKLETYRINGKYNFETMMGRKIGNDIVRLAAGISAEYLDQFKSAPSLELYKSWKKDHWRATVELRYDMLYHALTGYLVLQY